MSDKLKPCPFCGGEGFIFERQKNRYKVCCENACIQMPVIAAEFFTSDKVAIRVWNTRAGEAELESQLEQSRADKVELIKYLEMSKKALEECIK